MSPFPKWVLTVCILLSLAGFLDASYLTAKHYIGSELNCPLFGGCEKVTTSAYSVVLGIPVALLGAGYYLAILLLLLAYWDMGNTKLFYVAGRMTVLGLLASLWFLYLQIFVIHAICFYCIISASTSILLYILGTWVLVRYN